MQEDIKAAKKDAARQPNQEKEDFANLTGYLRVLEKRILSDDALNKLIGVSGFQETVKTLAQSSEYDFSSLQRAEDYETVLSTGLKELYASMYKKCGEPLVLDVLSAKYDYHNIKVALKSKYLGKSHERLYIGVTAVSPELIVKAVNGGPNESLPTHLAEACEKGAKAFTAESNPQDIDIVLDGLMFSHMLSICGALKNDFAINYVRLCIEFHNVKTLLRVKSMKRDSAFLEAGLVAGGFTDASKLADCLGKPASALVQVISEYGGFDKFFVEKFRHAVEGFERTGNYAAAERFFDNYLINFVKKSKFVSYGPEVLFSYVISKENELRQIRIILTCKLNGIGEDVLRERLRDNYA